MEISVTLEDGLLPDRFGKFCSDVDRRGAHPARSFPIAIREAPANTKSFALTFLDWDAVPVGGFCWIHWTACDIAPATISIPEDASRVHPELFTQGKNSYWSPFAGSVRDPLVVNRYAGPCPPDRTHIFTLTVYAADRMLGLPEGFYLNELRRALHGHVLAAATLELPSRAQ